MSDAKVTFETLDYEPAEPGKEVRFEFRCPKHPTNRCGPVIIAGRTTLKRNGQNQAGGVAQWDWDGNREAPTFKQSIDCRSCPGKWHGYIEKGRCVNTAKQDEPEPA